MPAFAASLTEQELRDLVSCLPPTMGLAVTGYGLKIESDALPPLAIGATIALAVAIIPGAALAQARSCQHVELAGCR